MIQYMVTTPIPHESLFKKYAHKRYFRVCLASGPSERTDMIWFIQCSSFMIQWSLARWPENGRVDLEKDVAHIKEEIVRERELEAQ